MTNDRLTEAQLVFLRKRAQQSDQYIYRLRAADVELMVSELLECREAADKPVLNMLFKNGWPVDGTTGIIGGSPSFPDGYHDFYATPQQESGRERVRREHAAWSLATFGDVGPVGPLKHLSREALEAAANPCDPFEWADMQFLLWDAQMRMGISDEFITWAMVEKLAINKARQWPEPKDGEPCLHLKEAPQPEVKS